jgi:hypothetical protein
MPHRDPVGNDPKAQELATDHEKVALAIQKHLAPSWAEVRVSPGPSFLLHVKYAQIN